MAKQFPRSQSTKVNGDDDVEFETAFTFKAKNWKGNKWNNSVAAYGTLAGMLYIAFKIMQRVLEWMQ